MRPVEALIVPPPGGPAIVTVVETTFPNAIKQDISLATQARTVGENKISLILFTGSGGDGSDARLKDVPFTNVNLTQEALAAWPDTGMAVSPFYVQNDYGPFGYAIGKPANGDTCIYAWQRIRPTLKPSGTVDRGTVVIRLQLCTPRSSEQELLEVMYRLRLRPNLFSPLPASAAIGRVAVPIRPVGAEGFADVIPIAQPVPAQRPTNPAPAAPVTPVPTTPPVMVPPIGAPIVPSPNGAVGGPGGPTIPSPNGTTSLVPSPTLRP